MTGESKFKMNLLSRSEESESEKTISKLENKLKTQTKYVRRANKAIDDETFTGVS